ncbi:uncharacterized protein LOC103521559 [Diaphorina citri]|uniref:Uncharacterized protein LOC103521559 n=1 Tax=Diaphorina citri TaxID=121845 RepID=A0A3Q0JHV7_DIACI|nr:uncharacterized protein LOC103521559 [Diaphorina citri]
MSLGPDESKELSVSVRSKVVKLPENEVQLSSFVVPVEKDDPYQYQWTLLSSPEGGAETSMMDQNKARLQGRKADALPTKPTRLANVINLADSGYLIHSYFENSSGSYSKVH